jgi:hypothetical protein
MPTLTPMEQMNKQNEVHYKKTFCGYCWMPTLTQMPTLTRQPHHRMIEHTSPLYDVI